MCEVHPQTITGGVGGCEAHPQTHTTTCADHTTHSMNASPNKEQRTPVFPWGLPTNRPAGVTAGPWLTFGELLALVPESLLALHPELPKLLH